VRFWDSSALVALVIPEAGTARVRTWVNEDPQIAVWTLTRVELLSALARHRRDRPRAAEQLVRARGEVLEAWERWTEVTAVDVVRAHAERIVERHPLRAADALQIGAAVVFGRGEPSAVDFVTLDAAQAEAATREGFHVFGP
jgi:hypothetical protein